MFFHVPFNLELVATNVTGITSYKCFFMCKRHLIHVNVNCVEKHLYEVIPVTFVATSSRLKGTWKNIREKSTYIILVPSQSYQDFWLLLQNTKVPKIVLGFSNHAQRFTPPYYLNVDNPFRINRNYLLKEYKKGKQNVCQLRLYGPPLLLTCSATFDCWPLVLPYSASLYCWPEVLPSIADLACSPLLRTLSAPLYCWPVVIPSSAPLYLWPVVIPYITDL